MRYRKKRPFVLTEVLIALTILTSVGLPLLYAPHRGAKRELQSLKKIDLHRLMFSTWAEIHWNLVDMHSWDALPTKKSESPTYTLDPTTLSLMIPYGGRGIPYHRSYTLWIDKTKMGAKGAVALLRCKVVLTPSHSPKLHPSLENTYTLCIRQMTPPLLKTPICLFPPFPCKAPLSKK